MKFIINFFLKIRTHSNDWNDSQIANEIKTQLCNGEEMFSRLENFNLKNRLFRNVQFRNCCSRTMFTLRTLLNQFDHQR